MMISSPTAGGSSQNVGIRGESRFCFGSCDSGWGCEDVATLSLSGPYATSVYEVAANGCRTPGMIMSRMLSVRQGSLWVVAVTPFLLAAVVHWGRPPVPLAISATPRPALAFDQYLVDLGPTQPMLELHGKFRFRNRGGHPVKLTTVEPSCGCLQPLVSAKEFAPGEDGQILLRMRPANESPGKKEYYADVKYTDPEPREVRITFKLELPERGIMVKPRALLVYQLSGEKTVQELRVIDSRDRPARIKDVSVNSPLIGVELGERRPGETGGIESIIQVIVDGQVSPGRHDAVITVYTDDPETPEVRVPVIIQGPRTGDVAKP